MAAGRVPAASRVLPGPRGARLLAFLIYPLFATIFNSLLQPPARRQLRVDGLGNFDTLLFDPTWSGPFWNALLATTAWFFVIHMLVQNPIGLAAGGTAQPAAAASCAPSTAR